MVATADLSERLQEVRNRSVVIINAEQRCLVYANLNTLFYDYHLTMLFILFCTLLSLRARSCSNVSF